MSFIQVFDNMADAVTGERIFPGDVVFNTGLRNENSPFSSNGRTRVLKESTIVQLAQAAGYDVVKRDVGDSGNTEGVDESDVIVGGGEVEVGESPVGGGKASKRRSDGASKG